MKQYNVVLVRFDQSDGDRQIVRAKSIEDLHTRLCQRLGQSLGFVMLNIANNDYPIGWTFEHHYVCVYDMTSANPIHIGIDFVLRVVA